MPDVPQNLQLAAGAGRLGDVSDERPEVVAFRRRRFFEVFALDPELDSYSYAVRFGVDVRTVERWKREGKKRKSRRKVKKTRFCSLLL